MNRKLINIDDIDIDFSNDINDNNNNKQKISISNLLSNKNTTLEDLLNYDNLLDEFHSKNPELLNYFTNDKIKIMIDYMIKEPENDDYEKGHKFPFVCAEIFKLKIDNILNKFFNENDKDKNNNLLDKLFSFINNEKTNKKLNPILCEYFVSTIDILLNYNPNLFLQYVYLKKNQLLKIMSKCYNNSIMKILGEILFFEKYEINADIKVYQEEIEKIRFQILKDIFNNIDINMDNEKLISIYSFINNFFHENNIKKLKEIFRKIIDDNCTMKNLICNNLYDLDLINYSKDYEKIQNIRKNFIIIIDIIIILLKNIDILQLEKPKLITIEINHTKINENFFNIIGNLINLNFNKKNSKENKFFQSFNDISIFPLGEHKIEIIKLISNLIPYFSKISKYFDEILIKTEFFKHVFEYIFDYEWNNIYQEEVLNLMKIIILKNSSEHELLIDYLFEELKLLELIKNRLNVNNKFKYSNQISNNISRGYNSFLISLSYKINTAMEESNLKSDNNGSFEFRRNKIYIDNEGDDDFNFSNGITININHKNKKLEGLDNEIKTINSEQNNHNYIKKYLNDDWKLFFNNNIYGLIKQYDNKKWPINNKEKYKEDIFNVFNENDEKFSSEYKIIDLDEDIYIEELFKNLKINKNSDVKSTIIDSDLIKDDLIFDSPLIDDEKINNFDSIISLDNPNTPIYLGKKTKSENKNHNDLSIKE